MTYVDTSRMSDSGFRSTIPASLDAGPDTIPVMPAEACTEVGHEDKDTTMNTLSDWLSTLRAVLAAAMNEWRRQRYLRGGWRNPDECPF